MNCLLNRLECFVIFEQIFLLTPLLYLSIPKNGQKRQAFSVLNMYKKDFAGEINFENKLCHNNSF